MGGLYNVLFGMNFLAPVLKAILELDEFGEWKTGRFRDAFLVDEKTIIIYTRNGDGNRECVKNLSPEEIEKCSGCYIWGYKADLCPARACIVLKKHPCYIEDWDDEEDKTYAFFKFRVPKKYERLAKELYILQSDLKKKLRRD